MCSNGCLGPVKAKGLCTNCYSKQHYQDNIVKRKTQIKVWSDTNKQIRREHSHKYEANNRAKRNKEQREDRIARKERIHTIERKSKLKLKFGMTLEDYDRVLAEQNQCCAICKSPDPKTSRSKYFFVDHNHRTGKVRALLCSPCNSAIGLFNENTNFLQNAINYLKKHNAHD